MDELVPFGSRIYWITFAVMSLCRGADFLSTWVATPNLILEGNPLAKKMGWRIGLLVNLCLCIGFGLWPLPAVVISTTSLLVASRNFQQAWLMRCMGEKPYRFWHVARIRESHLGWFLLCLCGQAFLIALVGAALLWFEPNRFFPVAIGLGIIAYSVAILYFTLLSLWRIRRVSR